MAEVYTALQEECASLHDRPIRRRFPDSFGTLLFVSAGRVRVGEPEEDIPGPALSFWPGKSCPDLVLAAGSSARLLGLSDTILLDAIGARSESVHLRMLIEHPYTARLSADPEIPLVETLFDWIAHELGADDRRSRMKLSAYLRVLLIASLRVHSPEVSAAPTEATKVLREFRHLVELHYREQWQVARYAAHLGVEYDRLHRICKRETGRTPAELVRERLTEEARARLQFSGLPLKTIASDLGFADPSRFSHFFKRRTGMAPGAYRAHLAETAEGDPDV